MIDLIIDSMDGYEFEKWCAGLLINSGFSGVRITQESGDQGVDVLAEKDGLKYAFQCKRYNQAVGNKAVQEIYAGKAMYHCDVAVVITNNRFTESAKKLAISTRVQLWDRTKIIDMAINAEMDILVLPGEREETYPETATESYDYEMEAESMVLLAAIEIVMEARQASASMLQRKLNLGYSYCVHLMDRMEEIGLIGPFEGATPRRILLTEEQWEQVKREAGIFTSNHQGVGDRTVQKGEIEAEQDDDKNQRVLAEEKDKNCKKRKSKPFDLTYKGAFGIVKGIISGFICFLMFFIIYTLFFKDDEMPSWFAFLSFFGPIMLGITVGTWGNLDNLKKRAIVSFFMMDDLIGDVQDQPDADAPNLDVGPQQTQYSIEDIEQAEIDILLKQPTLLILSSRAEDCENMVSRMLEHCCSDFEIPPTCILINSSTDVFIMHRYHRCKPISAYNIEETKKYIDWAYTETDRRAKEAAREKKKYFSGKPVYLFLDNFSIMRQKPQDPIAEKLVHIMTCARQSNIHTIVFERPIAFQVPEYGWFSSLAVLTNCYRDKYHEIVPSQYRDIQPGTFFISSSDGKMGICKI